MVAERVLDPGLVERPGAGVEVRHLGLGLGVAGGEQLLRQRVVADLGVVVEPDQRLEERVEDQRARLERVLDVPGAERGRLANPNRRGRGEHRQGLVGELEIGGLVGRQVGASQGLDPGPLGHRARPGRPAAVELEVVLPDEAAGAVDGQRDDLREHRLHSRVISRPGGVQPVGLSERREDLELDPLAGVVLPYELGARELDVLPRREERPRRPPLAVHVQRQEQRGQAARGELARDGDVVEVLDHGLELGGAGAAEAALGAERGVEARVVGGVLRGGDPARGQQAFELAGDGLLRAASSTLWASRRLHSPERC